MSPPYPKGTCPECGRYTATRMNGVMMMHLPPEVLNTPPSGKRKRCAGSGKPAKRRKK